MADLYKASRLRVLAAPPEPTSAPPWTGAPPPLPVYRERGHQRLSVRTYRASCERCMWACEMPVDIIVDHWNPGRVERRTETFCYGPLSCRLYRAGPKRQVPGRRGMTYVEEDWVDEDAVAHRAEE